MEHIQFPDGAILIFLRHANSRWNKLRNESYESDSFPPVRRAGSRDSRLSAQGRVEVYLTGDLLKKMVGGHVLKTSKVIDFLGFSMAERSRQTAHIMLESSGFCVGCTYASNLLDERRHYSFKEAAMRTCDQLVPHKPNAEMQCRHDTLLQYISLNVACEDGENISPTNSIRDALMMDPVSWFDQYIKETSAELMSNFLECFIAKYRRLEKSEPSLPPDQIKIRSLAYALSSNLAIYAPSIANWACNEMHLPVHMQRKTPTGENMPEVVERSKKYLEFMSSLVNDSGLVAPLFVSVTHSLSLLAIRQVIEGFDDEHLNSMLKSDGPPFPPNVGMVIYRSHFGKLVRSDYITSPYHLAPELKPLRRRLYVTAQTDVKRVYAVADAVNAKSYLEPLRIGQDTVQVYGFSERRAVLERPSERPSEKPSGGPGIASARFPKRLIKSAS
ncbi:MAG: phosphoglycerate mutase family protein [Patescibacteria group bacterium]|nr:phosphoglycerate mutase family protein [Patescibacteria group bacterium]